RYALFASPAYLARRGRPASPETDLRGHDLVTYDARMDALPEVDWLRARATDDDLTLRFNTLAGIVAAVESGAGLGVLPDFLAGDHLVCLCAGEALPRREVWLAVHEDVHRLPRVRTVVDFLAAQLAAA
ncbi:MAG: hypothetical protein KC583_17175, partial [Myxococcales bacterium]|nr:hypothetical protein [Myxococcales bacterium]